MKTTLPEKSKEHEAVIFDIRDIILKHYQDKIAFILLFGSFARGDWVYDYYTEDHIDYEFASDYDFLILTKKNKHGSGHCATNMKHHIENKLKAYGRPYKAHTPTLIIESMERMNKELENGQYFFSDIKEQGVLLYDSGEFELKEAKALSNEEMKAIAQDYFDQWFTSGVEFLIDCNNALERESYNKSAFELHQATESFFCCTLLVLTGYKPKSHDLKELNKLCSSQSNQFLNIFPMATQDEKDCFELLKIAYIDARYNKDYKITEDQLKYLIGRVEKLKEVTKVVCEERINALGLKT